MAALLVALSVMAVLMTAAMPVWTQVARREKEEELVFRGQQYARAIGLFQRRSGPGVLPPSIDVLVEQRFLRKKYKDPITNDDFDLVRGATPGATAQPGQTAAGAGPAQASTVTVTTAPGGGRGATVTGAGGGAIAGVVSKSKDTSIRLYNGRTHYNEWVFVYTPPVQAPGAGAGAGAVAPGQRVAPPLQAPGAPGAPGRPPFQRTTNPFSAPPPQGQPPPTRNR